MSPLPAAPPARAAAHLTLWRAETVAVYTIKRGGRTLATVGTAAAAYRWLVDNERFSVAHALTALGYSVTDEHGDDGIVYDVATDSYRPVEGEIPPRQPWRPS